DSTPTAQTTSNNYTLSLHDALPILIKVHPNPGKTTNRNQPLSKVVTNIPRLVSCCATARLFVRASGINSSVDNSEKIPTQRIRASTSSRLRQDALKNNTKAKQIM